jgi:hypothetical protein
MNVQGTGDLDVKLFSDSEKSFQTADHLLYFVYPMLKDQKLIKKALEEIFSSARNLVNSILLFEHKKSNIRVYQEKEQNIETFIKISTKLEISKPELDTVLEILNFNEKHQKSPTEFVRNNQIIILLENQKYETITFEKLKSYVNILKTVIQKFRLYREQKF